MQSKLLLFSILNFQFYISQQVYMKSDISTVQFYAKQTAQHSLVKQYSENKISFLLERTFCASIVLESTLPQLTS